MNHTRSVSSTYLQGLINLKGLSRHSAQMLLHVNKRIHTYVIAAPAVLYDKLPSGNWKEDKLVYFCSKLRYCDSP